MKTTLHVVIAYVESRTHWTIQEQKIAGKISNMSMLVIGSLSLVILVQTVSAAGLYDFARQCKSNTEPCVRLRCSSAQRYSASLPVGLHYLCCNGKIFDQKKYVCVRYKYSSKIVLSKCDTCAQFRCGDGQCTLKQWKCNNVKDCLDGTDEVGCGPCGKNQFYCRRARQCINADKVCDKYNDCKDGSDELNCPTETGSRCGSSYYRCKNNQCIPWNRACDGRVDCKDHSDEAGRCGYYIRKYGGKRDEISSISEDAGTGGKGADVGKGTFAN